MDIIQGIVCEFNFGEEGILRIRIYNQREEQIKNLFNNFNKEYDRGIVEGSFEEYLKAEKIDYELFDFDLTFSI